ncbi:ANK3 [Symbiodinium necroappetens]|uniref:ANK3 protein n=1 Tax=Symbiodinium necroappetens TaxID=1628268 RepID=A0A813B4M7_9DINO|nr:ANK3 [Symbiodinium necroappetens]
MASCSLAGLAKEWEATPEIRNSLREGKPLIHEVSEKQVDIKLPSKFSAVIKPILVRMAAADKKMPGVDALRAEIQSVLDLTKRLSNDEGEIDKYTWLIRKQLTFIKVPSFQDLILTLDPALQDVVDAVNENRARRIAASAGSAGSQEATDEDEDAYDDDDDMDGPREEGVHEDANAGAGGAGCDDLHELMNDFRGHAGASVGEAEQPSEEPIFPSSAIVIADDADDLAEPAGSSQDSGRALEMAATAAGPISDEVPVAVVDGANGGPTTLGSAAEAEASGCSGEAKASGCSAEAKASDEQVVVKPGISERAQKLARLAELKQRIEQLKGKKQQLGTAGSVSSEGPSEVPAGIPSVPAFVGPVLDDQDTLPHNILEVETPPPSSEPPSSSRKESAEVTAAELREDYQQKQCKTKKMKPLPGSAKGARLPYNPYSPEVSDESAKGSSDPFTPDEKVTMPDIGRMEQLAVRGTKKAEDKRGAKNPKKNGDADKKKNAKPEGEDKYGGYTAEEWEQWLDWEGEEMDEDGDWDGDQWAPAAEPEKPAAPKRASKKRKAEASLEDDVEPEPSKKAVAKAKAKAKASPKAKSKAKAKASAKKGAKASAKAPEPEPEEEDGDDDDEPKVVTFARRYRAGSRKMAMARFDAIRNAFMTIVRPKIKSNCPSSFEDPFWTHCVAEFKNWNIDLDTLEAACETAAESFVKKIEKEFVLCLLLLIFTRDEEEFPEDMEFLEFFAGRANLTYACRRKNYKCAKFDILYHDKDVSMLLCTSGLTVRLRGPICTEVLLILWYEQGHIKALRMLGYGCIGYNWATFLLDLEEALCWTDADLTADSTLVDPYTPSRASGAETLETIPATTADLEAAGRLGDAGVDSDIEVDDLQMLKFFEGLPRVKMEQEALKSPEPHACRPDAPDEAPLRGSNVRPRLQGQDRLLLAARARLGRFVAPKKNRKELEAPAWVKEHWKGHKQEMSMLMKDCNFDKECFLQKLERIITKKEKQKIKLDAGWYSEAEMKSELKWGPTRVTGALKYCRSRPDTHVRKNQYDQVEEYWITSRESGTVEESLTKEEKHYASEKADKPVDLGSGFGSGLAAMQGRKIKSTLKKFVDSIVQKTNKMKGLIKDLRDNFSESADVSIKDLNDQVQKMEYHYEKCNEIRVRGDCFGFNDALFVEAEKQMKDATFVRSSEIEGLLGCSKAMASDTKIRNDKKFYSKSSDAGPKRAGWPKKVYEEEGAFDRLLRCCKRDNDFMLHEGLVDKRTNKKYYAIVLAVVGDWQWLVKSGKLGRNYNHVLKSSTPVGAPEGICHLCQAGQRDYPFETFQTRSPTWLATFCAQDPFVGQSPLASLPHMPGQAATLFKYDVWHTCHLGVCKPLAGSALALLSLQYPGRSKDAKMEKLSDNFMEWCKRNGRQPLLTKITKDTILWDNNTNFPSASWYKGSLSTTMCEYIEDVTKDKQFDDVLLMKCSEAVQALNKFITGLYEADVFLSSNQAYTLGEYGLQFLRRYSWCAGEAARQSRCLFIILPKMHCLQHICLQDLVMASQRFDLVVNPLVHSVQLCEDYVGRNSRTSRRIHPSTCTVRAVQRHLQLAFAKYVEAGYLVDDSAQID